MSFQSKSFYFKVSGDYALWTSVESKGGGERFSYSVPTRQGLHGIVDAIYFKPTFTNIVEEVKVMKPILTDTKGVRAMVGKGKADLNYVTYLEDVEYLVKYHFIWNVNREDLSYDRNARKHEAIMERSILKGGRRDIFLGTRECLAHVEAITEEMYEEAESYYSNQTISLGIMFHSFKFPSVTAGRLESYFANTIMKNGVIKFKTQEECEFKNELSSYIVKTPKEIKDVATELMEYERKE
ncbi:type I-C CRISPR-associated protein Cas5c [Macrococcus carouselicus]|uniref:pre-crRNA processing endonuclease n=1 Tax=Macrococcus carouselicus TaxID=69969 RepID=A0A9Q8CMG3_9STAP|nr:type I-C CRISPR-associated protein Cas5c [Macrococcus carouselicus]TDM04007.1 type I-C CRISPR-associated protein Cas5 [Macrococcus carouselicus]